MILKNTVDSYAALINVWEVNIAKIITWINNYIEHSIGVQLAKYETTKKV